VTLQDDSTTDEDADKGDQDFPFDSECEGPQLFAQRELNDLLRDLELSKEKAELLSSRPQEKNLLASGTLVMSYRSRDQEFTPFFTRGRVSVLQQYSRFDAEVWHSVQGA
jgi:hypothetical protein